jgi:hypothetical protein
MEAVPAVGTHTAPSLEELLIPSTDTSFLLLDFLIFSCSGRSLDQPLHFKLTHSQIDLVKCTCD